MRTLGGLGKNLGANVDRATAIPHDVGEWFTAVVGRVEQVRDVSWPKPQSRVWMVSTRCGDVFLKVSPSDAAFQRETDALTKFHQDAPFEFPHLIGSHANLRAIILSKVDGDLVRVPIPAPEKARISRIYEQAGMAARWLHNSTPVAADGIAKARRMHYVLDKADERQKVGAAALDRDDRGVLKTAREVFMASAPSAGLGVIHGDFQPRNWLWDTRHSRFGLIDFETMTVGFVIEDLGWMFATQWHANPRLRASFLSGYGGALRKEDELLLCANTALGALEHVADGIKFGADIKVENGRKAITTAGKALRAVLSEDVH